LIIPIINKKRWGFLQRFHPAVAEAKVAHHKKTGIEQKTAAEIYRYYISYISTIDIGIHKFIWQRSMDSGTVYKEIPGIHIFDM
jgi:nucleoside 2-deoxyribosyltransferase